MRVYILLTFCTLLFCNISGWRTPVRETTGECSLDALTEDDALRELYLNTLYNGLPAPRWKAKVAIVGGGVSGLVNLELT